MNDLELNYADDELYAIITAEQLDERMTRMLDCERPDPDNVKALLQEYLIPYVETNED